MTTTTKTLCIGIDASGSRVNLTLTLKTEQPRAGKREVSDLHLITEPFRTLSITGSSRAGGGQMQDTIRKELPAYRNLFLPEASIVRILDIWDRWHLNDMRAGTLEQSAAVDAYLAGSGKRYDYTDVRAHLATLGLRTSYSKHTEPNANGQMVPVAYNYGSAWLVELLPAEVEAEILGLFTPAADTDAAEVLDAGAQFLKDHGLTFRAVREGYGPYFPGDTESRDIYNLTLSAKDRGHYTTRFGQSLDGTAKGAKPTAYDLLASLTKNDPGSFQDFCGDFGYSTDTPAERKAAEKAYRAAVREWEKVSRFFTAAELSDLQEIA